MAKVNSFLTNRLKLATEKLSKMTSLAQMSANGNLSSFSGVFRVTPLTEKEELVIKTILEEYCDEKQEIEQDLLQLLSLTSEVKAINNQAAILHGERIKKAQEILKRYRDGAFSNWLMATYGNRQTPYNFLQYYELYTALPTLLHAKLDLMPRQVVYTLASRAGPLEKKEELIRNYAGETKQDLLSRIRETFPLEENDKRASNHAEQALQALSRFKSLCNDRRFRPTTQQRETLKEQLATLLALLTK